MQNAPSDLAHDIEDLTLAATRVQRHIQTLSSSLLRQTEDLAPGLLTALIDLADARDASEAHHEKWRDVPYEGDGEDSQQQRREWAPICERVCSAERRVREIAKAVRDAAERPQLPLAPLSIKAENAGDTMGVGRLPESRL